MEKIQDFCIIGERMVLFFTEMQKKKKEQVRMERRTGSSIVDILSFRCQFFIQLELLREQSDS